MAIFKPIILLADLKALLSYLYSLQVPCITIGMGHLDLDLLQDYCISGPRAYAGIDALDIYKETCPPDSESRLLPL